MAEYIRFVQDNIQRMSGQPCPLDGGSTEKRALSLIEHLEALYALGVMEECSVETLYFAYGSNINLNQMAVRCPDAKVVEPAVLENYELLFRGNAHGYGVATIRFKEGSQVREFSAMATYAGM